MCPADKPDFVMERCVPACKSGQIRTGHGICICPEAKPDLVNDQCVPACKTGQTRNTRGECVCPAYQVFDGTKCVIPPVSSVAPITSQGPSTKPCTTSTVAPTTTSCTKSKTSTAAPYSSAHPVTSKAAPVTTPCTRSKSTTAPYSKAEPATSKAAPVTTPCKTSTTKAAAPTNAYQKPNYYGYDTHSNGDKKDLVSEKVVVAGDSKDAHAGHVSASTSAAPQSTVIPGDAGYGQPGYNALAEQKSSASMMTVSILSLLVGIMLL